MTEPYFPTNITLPLPRLLGSQNRGIRGDTGQNQTGLVKLVVFTNVGDLSFILCSEASHVCRDGCPSGLHDRMIWT